MSHFQPSTAFEASDGELELLPFRFERLDGDQYLVSNLVGDMTFLSGPDLRRLAALDLAPDDALYALAFEKLLLRRKGQRAPLQLLAMRQRSRSSFLRTPTQLHILVVTLRCEHSCPYCQVSRRSTDRDRYDMSFETAARAVEVALSSPSPHIKLEFQGGEPLLNFDLIRAVVPFAREKAEAAGKTLDFVITSNLALLNDDVLAFCKTHDIVLSTSLDGPEDLHNRNRPRPGGDSHQLAVEGIRRAQATLGKERVGALMTTTEASLGRVEEIVDEYVRLGLDGIFLRPLSPYGFAVKTKQYAKYDSRLWLEFYERGLRYILRLNREGTYFPEFYATLLARRMLSDIPTGYVDLRSPAGIGLGALVYNYDGKVFASDEGRMLAEMGDRTFELGDLATDDYASIILSDKLIDLVGRSLTQCAPQCSSCAFEPHCGADPVYHHATQTDPVGIKPLSGFCARQKGIMTLLVDLLENSPEDAAVLRRWAA
ncbi:MAG TPA: His-Xaa-Ser system radical SAM maturase HxsB [Caulobacteraceae bacterium]|jgi:His-Xaa-Ser system radical SAM maturase HxsB|nr:His-Xaa-Ser system radical SAM maturase HxsB [Caulobacteraceae bacterium]